MNDITQNVDLNKKINKIDEICSYVIIKISFAIKSQTVYRGIRDEV